MRFTCRVNLMYNGVYHKAGERFEIDPKDAEEMSFFGTVEKAAEETAKAEEPDAVFEKPKTRRKK